MTLVTVYFYCRKFVDPDYLLFTSPFSLKDTKGFP